MKDQVLRHAGALLGGMVHNLNTPLMWVMGRAQLMEARNDGIERLVQAGEEELARFKAKNAKDIASISEGAERIDQILKAVGYKIQMAEEGQVSLELRDYLRNETAFLMSDMRFKHETKTEFAFDSSPSVYADIDYNALSWAFVSLVNLMLDSTAKGRNLVIGLEDGAITVACPECAGVDEGAVRAALSGLVPEQADCAIENAAGLKVVIRLKGVR
ncbi:MAG: His Kinase A (phospho-acceptor) domain protein [Deltaproteobacteria bacterium ADurb.Bin510]|nr:MAG: His Kinase A (phospho-acceptor) domain protein [Deltaproteobacteria bacterium ADurb.Bin510]